MDQRDAPEEPLTGRVLRAAAARDPSLRVSPLLPNELQLRIAEYLPLRSSTLLNLALASSDALGLAMPLLLSTFSVRRFAESWRAADDREELGRRVASIELLLDRRSAPALYEARSALDYLLRAGLADLVRTLEADCFGSRLQRSFCRRAVRSLASEILRELRFQVFGREDLATLSAANLRGLAVLQLELRTLPNSEGPEGPVESMWATHVPELPALRTLVIRGHLNPQSLEALCSAAPNLEALELAPTGSSSGWMDAAAQTPLARRIRGFDGRVDEFFELRRRSKHFRPARVCLRSAGNMSGDIYLTEEDWHRLLALNWAGVRLGTPFLRSSLLSLGLPRDADGLDATFHIEVSGITAAALAELEAFASSARPGWFSAGCAEVRAKKALDRGGMADLFREGLMWERLLGKEKVEWHGRVPGQGWDGFTSMSELREALDDEDTGVLVSQWWEGWGLG
ncbi:hypothetical protein DFJ74DRAFT_668066 [Hyaloraphidium curvatum]|nr:hypothetical protein DFJ74DRAFT_668066 [Hyaloraphidium curvatum]